MNHGNGRGAPQTEGSRNGTPNGGNGHSHGERLARIENELRHLASKEDLANLQTAMTKEAGDLRTELVEKMGAMESRLLKWQIAIVISAALLLGIAALIAPK